MTVVAAAAGSWEPVEPGPGPLDVLVGELERTHLRWLVRQLPARERKVLDWRFGLTYEPRTVREVAKRLGVSVRTAWRIEQRALEHLRTLAADDELLADAA